jgi:hypothetical protein
MSLFQNLIRVTDEHFNSSSLLSSRYTLDNICFKGTEGKNMPQWGPEIQVAKL